MGLAIDTGFPADSLEFCPHSSASDIFVCGTYKLEEDKLSPDSERTTPQYRRGECLVFQVESSDSDVISCHKIQELHLPAVLDMKWRHVPDNTSPLLAVADSEGNVTLHQFDLTERRLSFIDRIPCASPDVLCLSLDWSDRLSSNSSPGWLVVSLSNGSLCILRPRDTISFSLAESWHAHDHEPWAAACSYWDTNIIYSGGDDLKLKTWDIRQGFVTPVFTNKRFDAGVTSIQSHPRVQHVIAVGSYDNTVRLFDARKPLIPFTQADVGGGAWRVKWHPSASRKNDLLVASMHDGFKIVRFDMNSPNDSMPAASEGTIVKRFDEHASLAYGVDWSFAPSDSTKDTIIGSCSFYDHTLNLWRG